jgi:hypothetical protein
MTLTSWTLYSRQGNELFINPDPFIFQSNLEQFKYFSNFNRTCMLWCIPGSNVCAGANLLDSDLWELQTLANNASQNVSTISGNWRIVAPGRLILLFSESSFLQTNSLNGPPWFLSLTRL